MINPIELTAELVKCPSVTPKEAGALVLLENILTKIGFTCHRIDRAGVSNLFARWGSGKTLGFNGHIDVVPVGDQSAWSLPPFGATIKDGFLYGRGSTDMKSAVAAFVAAAAKVIERNLSNGSIVLTITSDEEGIATDGTAAILEWMAQNNQTMDDCIVGEPTCPNEMGEMIKIGRRGSMTAYFTAHGIQGHSAYPHQAKNPVPVIAKLMDRLASHELDSGTEHFDASTLAITTIDTGNTANNVIPAQCNATINIRFNDSHSSDSLIKWLSQEAAGISAYANMKIDLKTHVSGESFITAPGHLSTIISNAVHHHTGRIPELSTTGGTSDARFIKSHCPVVECGLVGKTMHQIDECVSIKQIKQLTDIYTDIIIDYFK